MKIGFNARGAWLKTCGLVFSEAAEMHGSRSPLMKVHADLLLFLSRVDLLNIDILPDLVSTPHVA